MEIANLTDEDREANGAAEDANGVLVKSVEPDSVAADAGLRAGQVILEVNQKEISSVADAMRERGAFDGKVLLLRVSAGGSRSIVAIRIE